MQFPADYEKVDLRNQPKGAKQILLERGLWRDGMLKNCQPKCTDGRKDCCAIQTLSNQRDFQTQQGRLQEMIERAGHKVVFYPKFHCELNFIEYFWAAAKRYAREHCEYSLQGLRKTVPKAIESVPDHTIWRYHQKSLRIMRVYREGIEYGSADFVQRVYKSHRRVTKQFDDD